MRAKRIVADLLFTNDGPPLTDVAIDVDAAGRVLELIQGATDHHDAIHAAVVAPGFVNAHCHLELSHLKGLIDGNARGMAHFIGRMMDFRRSRETLPDEGSLQDADRSMWEEGVVAVGDIANTLTSLGVKAKSSIRYHTFIEVMGLSGDRANAIWQAGYEMKKAFESVLGEGCASVTPHGLYSVSAELMAEILSHHPESEPLSIHMQESADELEYCRDKSGPLAALFSKANIPDSGWIPYGNESPLLRLMRDVPRAVRFQTVHNTFTSADEIHRSAGLYDNQYWCICPSANLHITGRLPDVMALVESGARITIGTDSLASNNRLSMVKELSLLQDHFPGLSTEMLVRAASLHGAQFLGFDNELGSIVRGKSPGLVVLENMNPGNPRFHKEVKARRLVPE